MLLIRDPFDSIWSEFQRRVTKSHVEGIYKVGGYAVDSIDNGLSILLSLITLDYRILLSIALTLFFPLDTSTLHNSDLLLL